MRQNYHFVTRPKSRRFSYEKLIFVVILRSKILASKFSRLYNSANHAQTQTKITNLLKKLCFLKFVVLKFRKRMYTFNGFYVT